MKNLIFLLFGILPLVLFTLSNAYTKASNRHGGDDVTVSTVLNTQAQSTRLQPYGRKTTYKRHGGRRHRIYEKSLLKVKLSARHYANRFYMMFLTPRSRWVISA